MAEKTYEDLQFILDAAPRLVRIASMTVICLGLAEGSNDRLLGSDPPTDHDWHQSLIGYRHCSLMMVVINLTSLLDRDERTVSFQAVHRLLKLEDVQSALFAHLERQNGPDGLLGEFRQDKVDQFSRIYGEISWPVHSRLVHFRNLGVAHLTTELMTKSITFDEMRRLVSIVSRLALCLQELCHVSAAHRLDMLDEWRVRASQAFREKPLS